MKPRVIFCIIFLLSFILSNASVNALDISVSDAANVEETATTLRGTLHDDSGENCTFGFWYGTTCPVNESNADVNATCPELYNYGDTVNYGISSLTSGQLYCFRPWANDSHIFMNNTREYRRNFTIIPSDQITTIVPQTIWDHNSSIAANDTCENFVAQGGVAGNLYLIFYDDPIQGWISWWDEDPENPLTNLQGGEEYIFTFHGNGTIYFNYDLNPPDNGSYFLTKPNKPQNLNVTNAGPTNISLSWTPATVVVSNRTTVIAYGTGGYPSTPHEGTVAYNGSGNSCNIDGLSPGTTYFFSAWTYINASGSPFLWWYSDLYGYTSGTTFGGNYTVHVRYEGNGTYVNLSDVNMTHTFKAEKSIGELLYSCHPTNSTGRFNFTTEELVDVATFTYNSLCERSVLVDPSERNITFYISDAEEGVYLGNLTAVTINFIDPMNLLTVEKNPIGWIYKYNETGRQYIHMDYLQADVCLRTWLVIGETYHVGVGSSVFTIDNLRTLSIYSSAEFDITVMSADMGTPISSTWYNYFQINQSFTGGVINVDFVDTSFNATYGSVHSALIKLYYYSNGTLIETVDAADIGTPWHFTYNYVGDSSIKYKVHIIVQYLYNHTTVAEDITQDYTEQWTKTIYLYFWEGPEPVIVPDDFDDKLNNTIGLTPTYYIDSEGITHIVSWSATLTIFLAMIPLLLFGREFAGFGVIGCGILLFVFNSIIKMVTIENIALAMLLITIGILVHLVTKKGG